MESLQTAIRVAMIRAGVDPGEYKKDYTTDTIIDSACHSIPAVGPFLAGGVNFVDGLVNGEDYREKQKAVEAQQGAMIDGVGLGKVPLIKDITAPAHAAGNIGASIHDFFDWATD